MKSISNLSLKKLSNNGKSYLESENSTITMANNDKIYKASTFDIWALGITIVIGGQYFSWNAGLEAGFGSFIVAVFLVGTAYICLCLCTSELSSTLPFAGGAYGLARCTLGFCPGFIIGCCETFEYILYVAASATTLSSMIVNFFSLSDAFQPLIWLLFYISALIVHIKGGDFFWRFNAIIAVISVTIIIIYVLGSFRWVDFTRNAVSGSGEWYIGGASKFVEILPLAAWFFVGIEGLNMSCDDAENPKLKIPRGQLTCIFTLFISAIFLLFVTASLPTGMDILISDLVPLNYGFMLMFNISYRTATLLSLPATYATAFGFIYSYGKLITAMSKSRLLPGICNRTTAKNGTPYTALIAGSMLGYAICLLVYFEPFIGGHLFSICILSACTAYIAQCIGYIQLQTKFANLPRQFRSPFGIAGAIYSMLVWILIFISLIGFQQDGHFAIIAYLGIIGFITFYYFYLAKRKQTFSEEEKKILFVAHVINNNNNKRKSLNNRTSNGSIVTPSGMKKPNPDNKRSSILHVVTKPSKITVVVDIPEIEKKFSSIGASDAKSEKITEDKIPFNKANKYTLQSPPPSQSKHNNDSLLRKSNSSKSIGDSAFKGNNLFKRSFKRQISMPGDLMEVREVNEDVSIYKAAAPKYAPLPTASPPPVNKPEDSLEDITISHIVL